MLIGTFTGMLQMHDRAGDLLLTRAVRAPVTIEGLAMINDNGRVAFQDRDTGGVETQYDAWLLASSADPKRTMAGEQRTDCVLRRAGQGARRDSVADVLPGGGRQS